MPRKGQSSNWFPYRLKIKVLAKIDHFVVLDNYYCSRDRQRDHDPKGLAGNKCNQLFARTLSNASTASMSLTDKRLLRSCEKSILLLFELIYIV